MDFVKVVVLGAAGVGKTSVVQVCFITLKKKQLIFLF